MAEISGMGKCGICFGDIQDAKTGVPSPIRHWKDHQLAHKDCWEKQAAYELTYEYQVEQAQQAVENAKQKINAANYELEVAEVKLKRLIGDVQS